WPSKPPSPRDSQPIVPFLPPPCQGRTARCWTAGDLTATDHGGAGPVDEGSDGPAHRAKCPYRPHGRGGEPGITTNPARGKGDEANGAHRRRSGWVGSPLPDRDHPDRRL